jgi:hypothetical protein
MSNFRTAMGKTVDMSSLIARNEKTRAVGNMKVNARGDTIDAHGRIIKPVTEKVSDNYAKTVGNRSANVVKKPNQLQPDAPKAEVPKAPEIDLAELNPMERELEESFAEEEIEIEKIKAEEVKTKETKKK